MRHAQDRAVEVDIFAAGEFGMKAGADFQQAADAADDFRIAGGGLGDAREDFEQGGFAGAIAADDPDDFTRIDIEMKRRVMPRTHRHHPSAAGAPRRKVLSIPGTTSR